MQRFGLILMFLLAAWSAASNLCAERPTATSAPAGKNTTRMVGMPIRNGFVLLNGHYVSPPYRLSRTDKTVLINDLPLPTPFRKHFRNQTNKRRFIFDDTGPEEDAQAHPLDVEAAIEQSLLADAMIIAIEPDFILVTPSFVAPELVAILESGISTEEKLERFQRFSHWNIPSSCWLRLMELYASNPELHVAMTKLTLQQETAKPSSQPAPTYTRTVWLQSTPIMSTALVVIAFGILIRVGLHAVRTPEEYRKWRNTDETGLRANLVLQMLLLLALLNLFDLLFTITAHKTGSFTEANPIGRTLLDNTYALSIFKLVLVGVGVSLLFAFRKRRVAELATWWICLVYTIILVRWVVVNSLLAY